MGQLTLDRFSWMGRKDAINLLWVPVGLTLLLEITWVLQVFDRNGGGRALASCGDCWVLSPGMRQGREKLGAQSVETISALTRRLLPLVRVITHSQPPVTAFPCMVSLYLIKGPLKYHLLFGSPIISSRKWSRTALPSAGVGACQSPQPQGCWKEHIGEAAFAWKWHAPSPSLPPFNPKSAVFQKQDASWWLNKYRQLDLLLFCCSVKFIYSQ